MRRLEHKVAVITGSARSIGAAVARRYAQEGAKVVINDIAHEEQAQKLVAEIEQNGGEAHFVLADVSEESGAQQLIEEAAKRFGTVDILVNNAAKDPRKKWNEITVEEWDHIMAVNVRSQFLCAKAAFPYMMQQQYGKIINVSSVTFFTGQRNFLHYVSSKGAIIGFTRALAREVGEHSIHVNCISPGAVLTESEYEKVSMETIEETARTLAKAQCFSRRQTAQDMEGTFVFLASSDSDFMTGQVLNVDGGWMMP